MLSTIPNILTFFRLVSVLFLPVVFLSVSRPLADWIVLVMFFVVSVTDYLDGYLARTLAQKSRIGQMLDPIADKALVLIALIPIIALNGMDPWIVLPAVVIMFREIFIAGMREFLGNQSVTLQVTPLAKWKTTLQLVSIGLLFTVQMLDQHILIATAQSADQSISLEGSLLVAGTALLEPISLVLFWLAGVLALITGFDYVRKTWPHLKGEPE